MNVLTLPDGQDSIDVWPSNGTSAVKLQAVAMSGSSPIVLTGGDVEGATQPVGDASSVEVQTLNIDTTGLGVGAVMMTCAGSVQLSGTAALTMHVRLDGSELSPPMGCRLSQADGSVAAYAMQGVIPLSEGPHTLTVVCTTDSGTTAVVNPTGGELGAQSISTLLWFLAA